MILPIFIPTPMFVYGGSGGGGIPSIEGVPDWKDAPAWAEYRCLTITGNWIWVAKKPDWDFLIGNWDAESLVEYMFIHSNVFDRSARKKSLQRRPAEYGEPKPIFNNRVMVNVDWDLAPKWAKYAAINLIGVWTWWAEKPSWDILYGTWEGSIKSASSSLNAVSFSRKDRKKSLTKRP